MLRVSYEWDCESVDVHGDIVDHHHADTLQELLAYTHGMDWEIEPRIVLVRSAWEKDRNLADRCWAHIDEDGMPESFSDGYTEAWCVPKRFVDEYNHHFPNTL